MERGNSGERERMRVGGMQKAYTPSPDFITVSTETFIPPRILCHSALNRGLFFGMLIALQCGMYYSVAVIILLFSFRSRVEEAKCCLSVHFFLKVRLIISALKEQCRKRQRREDGVCA